MTKKNKDCEDDKSAFRHLVDYMLTVMTIIMIGVVLIAANKFINPPIMTTYQDDANMIKCYMYDGSMQCVDLLIDDPRAKSKN